LIFKLTVNHGHEIFDRFVVVHQRTDYGTVTAYQPEVGEESPGVILLCEGLVFHSQFFRILVALGEIRAQSHQTVPSIPEKGPIREDILREPNAGRTPVGARENKQKHFVATPGLSESLFRVIVNLRHKGSSAEKKNDQ